MEAVSKLPVPSEVHYPTFEDLCVSEADILFDEAVNTVADDRAVSIALRGAAELTKDRRLFTALIVLSKHVLGEVDEVSDTEVVAVYDLIGEMQAWRAECAKRAFAEAS